MACPPSLALFRAQSWAQSQTSGTGLGLRDNTMGQSPDSVPSAPHPQLSAPEEAQRSCKVIIPGSRFNKQGEPNAER